MAEETILEKILAHKAEEVARQKLKVPLRELEQKAARTATPRDFAAALRRGPATALIAEVKKASPSKGVLIEPFDHLAIARAYAENGAAAISVLTDVRFFQGSLKYLEAISADGNPCPLLRKDFIIEGYQVVEARAYGADAILLIAAAIEDDEKLEDLLLLAQHLGMEALVEVHTPEELQRALDVGAEIVGVNNRDLHSFTTNLETTATLARLLPKGRNRPLLVSESGIFTPEHVAQVRGYGADAILVGEALIKAPDIGAQTRLLAKA
jgi:indole-3-glycerol phosphate synthase